MKLCWHIALSGETASVMCKGDEGLHEFCRLTKDDYEQVKALLLPDGAKRRAFERLGGDVEVKLTRRKRGEEVLSIQTTQPEQPSPRPRQSAAFRLGRTDAPVSRDGGRKQLRRVKVGVVGADEAKNPSAVLETRTRAVVMPIDLAKFTAIKSALRGEKFERPMTTDIFANVLGAFNVRAEAAEIDSIEDGALQATLRLRRGKRMRRAIDAPAADAIALAAHADCPILMDEGLLREAGVKKADVRVTDMGLERVPGPHEAIYCGHVWRYMAGWIVTRAFQMGAHTTEIHATRRGVTTTHETPEGKVTDVWLPAGAWGHLDAGMRRLAGLEAESGPGNGDRQREALRGGILITSGEREVAGEVVIKTKPTGGDIVVTYSDTS
ncbi:MAG: bifunctional nuclease domain-containing protein [Armatimonadota bacterium]